MKDFISRLIHSDTFHAVILYTFALFCTYTTYQMGQQYAKTLNLSYLFIYTILRLIGEKSNLILLGITILIFINTLVNEKIRKRYTKVFFIGYTILCLMVLSGQTIRMNGGYALNDFPLTTAHVLYYQLKDMVGNEEITFSNEPCEVRYKRETYFSIIDDDWIETVDYPYLYLNNQRDAIPIAPGYSWTIRNILEESNGVCDITCYKNTHIIKAINGVELTDLTQEMQ